MTSVIGGDWTYTVDAGEFEIIFSRRLRGSSLDRRNRVAERTEFRDETGPSPRCHALDLRRLSTLEEIATRRLEIGRGGQQSSARATADAANAFESFIRITRARFHCRLHRIFERFPAFEAARDHARRYLEVNGTEIARALPDGLDASDGDGVAEVATAQSSGEDADREVGGDRQQLLDALLEEFPHMREDGHADVFVLGLEPRLEGRGVLDVPPHPSPPLLVEPLRRSSSGI
jgi:hypothetical protein